MIIEVTGEMYFHQTYSYKLENRVKTKAKSCYCILLHVELYNITYLEFLIQTDRKKLVIFLFQTFILEY